MTNLSDVLDLNELSQMRADKRISAQYHPYLPLLILNYTARAQYLNEWTQAERVCRGLIVDTDTNTVIARGPAKFFNYGQSGAKEYPLDTEVTVTTKHDGSLGIGWYYKGHWGIATRGSFTSEQAVHATYRQANEFLVDKIKQFCNWDETPIYEIVYPENRIVLDYAGDDRLYPLGLVSNESGLIVDRFEERAPKDKDYYTLADVLSMPIKDNEEGVVIDILDGEGEVRDHLKLKGDRYKQLHALLTNTTGRRIWVQLAARACHQYITNENMWAKSLRNDPADFLRVNVEENLLEVLLTNVPDEFYTWVTDQIQTIEASVNKSVKEAFELAGKLRELETTHERYEAVKDHPMQKEILIYANRGDSGPIYLAAWRFAKPAGDETPFKTIED